MKYIKQLAGITHNDLDSKIIQIVKAGMKQALINDISSAENKEKQIEIYYQMNGDAIREATKKTSHGRAIVKKICNDIEGAIQRLLGNEESLDKAFKSNYIPLFDYAEEHNIKVSDLQNALLPSRYFEVNAYGIVTCREYNIENMIDELLYSNHWLKLPTELFHVWKRDKKDLLHVLISNVFLKLDDGKIKPTEALNQGILAYISDYNRVNQDIIQFYTGEKRQVDLNLLNSEVKHAV